MSFRLPKRLLALSAATVMTVGASTSCASTPSDRAAEEGRLDVVAAFYPLQFVVERVGGDAVTVSNLVKPGTEPHDLELTPRQTAQVTDADLAVYLKGFQPAVDEAVANRWPQKPSLDVARVEPLRDGHVPLEQGELHEDEKGKDPHVWLDPIRFALIGDEVAMRLSALDRDNAAVFRRNAKVLRSELERLDGEFRRGLGSCARDDIVVSHNAFGYLAERYGLNQVAITGLTPEEEPSAARLAEVAAYVRAHDVQVIFFETLVSPKVAKTLADEVGARTGVLDPLEGLEEDSTQDYFSVMRANLGALRGALRCT